MRTYLTAGDVARLAGRTPATVRQWEQRGVLPVAARTAGGIRLFDPAVVEALMRARTAREAGDPEQRVE